MVNKLRIYGGGSVMGILIFILLFPIMASAATLMLQDGIHVGMPSYVNPVKKDDGSVCVSSGKRELDLTICMVGVKFLSAAEERGFFRYDEIHEDGRNQVGGRRGDFMVYANGSWTYPTSHYKSRYFNIFEIDDVLCNAGDSTQTHSCYAAALQPVGNDSINLAIFAFAGIDVAERNGQVKKIREFIKAIKFWR